MAFQFTRGAFLPAAVFDRVTDLRVERPELVLQAAGARKRRQRLTEDGRLVILACDHPARHVVRVGDDPLAMGDRRAYLERIARVISQPGVDGVMATPDIIDELFLINHLLTEAGGPSLLDGKVLVGCLNRGGLAGSAWELDDFLTGHTPERIASMGLDAAKMMFRLNLREPAAARTIQYCAQWITELNRLGIPSFLEALSVEYDGTAWRMRLDADDMVRVVGVASALGDLSANVWLKLPFVPEFERVAMATTLPILILGGESHGEPARTLFQVSEAMKSGSNVRGVLVGRNVIWPGAKDPGAVAAAIAAVVRGMSPEEAVAIIDREAGKEIDSLRPLFN